MNELIRCYAFAVVSGLHTQFETQQTRLQEVFTQTLKMNFGDGFFQVSQNGVLSPALCQE